MPAWTPFDKFVEKLLDGNAPNLDTGGDVIRCALLTSAGAISPSGHDFWDELSSYEDSSADSQALANQTVTLDGGTVTFDADDLTWPQSAAGFTGAMAAVLYQSGAAAAGSALICFADLESARSNVGADLILEMDASGILTIN